jgi:hypothetical protein
VNDLDSGSDQRKPGLRGSFFLGASFQALGHRLLSNIPDEHAISSRRRVPMASLTSG